MNAQTRPQQAAAAQARLTACIALLCGLGAASARADDQATATSAPLPQVVIVGTSPVPGTGIDASKIPGNIQTLRAADLSREGEASLTSSINGQLGSVNVNEDLNDPFQPDILYHGFEASPVLGVSSGLAVYQNGVRVNEPFGDVVNWDLIPDLAIDRIDLIDSNPVYGLNALGGALSVTMKNGFNFYGGDASYDFGSFRRSNTEAEYGVNNGTLGLYAAVRDLHQDGWRFFAGDDIHQYYLALSARSDAGSLDLSYARANNELFGQGAAPVQSLALSTEEIFTSPQAYADNVDFLTLNGAYKLDDARSLQGVLYYRSFRQSVSNGNTTNYTACTNAPYTADLCQPDGLTPLTGADGSLLPDISQGGTVPIGENDFESVRTQGEGGSLQLNDSHTLAGHDNQLTVGLAIDTAHVNFQSGAQIGLLSPQLVVLPSDLYVATPESEEAQGYSATPVILSATNTYYGYYLTDTFDVTHELSLTASGRYNVAQVDLADHQGTALDGENRYTHFNPALGFTYAFTPSMNAFAGWSISNRAPTASEIECSNPTQPCLLPAGLAGDPPDLKQVVSHSFEVGVRGSFPDSPGDAAGLLRWNVSAFRTDLDDDIYAIATSLSTGFFQNIGSTRRQGVDAGLTWRRKGLSAYAQYSYVEATFGSGFTESSPSNPFADSAGDIEIRPGDRLPGVPLHRFKAGADVEILPAWTLGASLVVVSPQVYRGDESNQNPELGGYHVVDLHSSYRVNEHCEVFATIQNLFNERYSTFGTYADPTGIGAPGIPPNAVTNGPGVDNRFQSPAAPFAFFAGVRLDL